MDYKKIRILYLSLYSLSLFACLLFFLNVIFDMRSAYSNILLLISTLSFIPGIVFQLTYEEKYPTPSKRKKIGWLIAVLALPLGLYGDLILDFILGLI